MNKYPSPLIIAHNACFDVHTFYENVESMKLLKEVHLAQLYKVQNLINMYRIVGFFVGLQFCDLITQKYANNSSGMNFGGQEGAISLASIEVTFECIFG